MALTSAIGGVTPCPALHKAGTGRVLEQRRGVVVDRSSCFFRGRYVHLVFADVAGCNRRGKAFAGATQRAIDQEQVAVLGDGLDF